MRGSGRNNRVSLLKFLASCLVIFIHIPMSGRAGQAMDGLARIAVPFFFAISGYYALNASDAQLCRRMRKVVLLTLIGNVLYWGWHIYALMAESVYTLPLALQIVFTRRNLLLFLLFGENVMGIHLWYLPAVLTACGLYYAFRKRWSKGNKGNRLYYGLALFLYLIHLCLALGTSLLYIFYRNGLLFGVPLFAFGLFFREYLEERFVRWKAIKGAVVLWIVVGIALSLVQRFTLGKTEMPLGMWLVLMGLMTFSFVNIPEQTEQRGLRYLEQASTWIYIIHLLFYLFVETYYQRVLLLASVRSSLWGYPFGVMAASILVSMCIVACENATQKKSMKIV